LIAATLALFASSAIAAEPLKTVATFSVLGDMVKSVGGEKVEVTTLVGPDGDAHVYEPTPRDAKALASASVIFVNGLQFEGWIDRLIKASGTKARVVVVSKGVKPRVLDTGHDHDHGSGPGHEHGHRHHSNVDPHAWQNIENGVIYVGNVANGLVAADPRNAAEYRANARGYSAALLLAHASVKAKFSRLPKTGRTVVTSHDAFGYFADAYGLTFLAPEGLSTEGEPSAADVARLIRQIKRDKIRAVFMENMSDPRVLNQIVRETGAKYGGTLYADALSSADGPASTYLKMFEHNSRELLNALSPGS
jgi:zinc/manganese transport system substrate-binding protein